MSKGFDIQSQLPIPGDSILKMPITNSKFIVINRNPITIWKKKPEGVMFMIQWHKSELNNKRKTFIWQRTISSDILEDHKSAIKFSIQIKIYYIHV